MQISISTAAINHRVVTVLTADSTQGNLRLYATDLAAMNKWTAAAAAKPQKTLMVTERFVEAAHRQSASGGARKID